MANKRQSKKPRMGRPPLRNGCARDFIFRLKLNDSELDAIENRPLKMDARAVTRVASRFQPPLSPHIQKRLSEDSAAKLITRNS